MDTVKNILERLRSGGVPAISDLMTLLQAQGAECDLIYTAADRVRQDVMGEEVFLRGIIEFSNICKNRCGYCGINVNNREVRRYRMSDDEILETAHNAIRWGCGTVVLQSGVDPSFSVEQMGAIVRRIKEECGLAVTLSVGVLPRAHLERLKKDGCDRYLLRFETSDRATFARIHPDESFEQRIQCLQDLRELGYQVGSGFMIGLPDATLEMIAADIIFTTRLKLDMIGCGPFLAHPDTPMADKPLLADLSVYYKTIALLRLLNPRAHIPATTAFDALEANGRNSTLTRGANVFMPNLTPGKYRILYQLYPNKPCVDEDGAACALCVRGRLASLNRPLGKGPGDSRLNNERHCE